MHCDGATAYRQSRIVKGYAGISGKWREGTATGIRYRGWIGHLNVGGEGVGENRIHRHHDRLSYGEGERGGHINGNGGRAGTLGALERLQDADADLGQTSGGRAG